MDRSINKKLFRVLASCELMQTDHFFFRRTKQGVKKIFVKGDRLRFLTLTVPESSLPLRIVSSRFRAFSNSRWWRTLMRDRSYICVYEPHPSGHGWHIHILTNQFVPWRELDVVSRSYMFGHTDIESADSQCAFYVAKYITKSQVLRKAQDSRGVRLINVSRDLLPLYDINCSSPSVDFIRKHWDSLNLPVFSRSLFLYYSWVYTWLGRFLLPSFLFEDSLDFLNSLS